MPQSVVFFSYSHADKSYRDELLPVLQAVPRIREALWLDEQKITIGDRFHDKIQSALPEARVGILLVSNTFLTSDYITSHELPYLLQQAEQQALKLGCLFLTAIADEALKIPMVIHGQQRMSNLKDRIGANSPAEPLISLDPGQRSAIYKKLADWVVQQLPGTVKAPSPPPLPSPGPRFELAISLRARGDHWEHSFSLPHAANFTRPVLHCLSPAQLFSSPPHTVDGEELFQLLFGSEANMSGQILGAAFGLPHADPTRYPLRVRLLLDEPRLWTLPWGRLAYQGRRLADDGWTVEFHATGAGGFPEYAPHTCSFPGKVVLLSPGVDQQGPQVAAHIRDLQQFFQRGWQQAPMPTLVHTQATLREVLQIGSTRLVYYYGVATAEGLAMEEPEHFLPWSELAVLLQRSRSVSAVFLNLLGESSEPALAQARCLLDGATVVLVQCHERSAAAQAGRAGLHWLQNVFAASAPLDPVVALYRQQQAQVAAWTRYSLWHVVAPRRLEMPELVNLLLDRRSQRNEVLQAKNDFYTYTDRRIYQAVAFGTAGCQVDRFPDMASQHLRNEKRDQEVILQHTFALPTSLSSVQDVDELVRRRLGIAARQALMPALIPHDTMSGNAFWVLVLGWVLQQPLQSATTGREISRTVAAWGSTRLLPEVQEGKVRVIAIVAMETAAPEVEGGLEDGLAELAETLNTEDAFHLGELERLSGVDRRDLSNYFQNHQVCSCDDRYRQDFPRLLLAQRAEMPFEEAVATIRRGEPDNWGNLCEELRAMSAAGDWPPAANQRHFWESRDGR